MNFIKREQDSHWMYVSSEDEPESPIPTGPRSVVVIPNDPMVLPNPRKEKKGRKVPSPVPLDNYEDNIHLEEPTRKVRKMTTPQFLKDLECSSSSSEDSPRPEKEKQKSENSSQREKENKNEKKKGKRKMIEKTKEKEKDNVLKEKDNNKHKANGKEKKENQIEGKVKNDK